VRYCRLSGSPGIQRKAAPDEKLDLEVAVLGRWPRSAEPRSPESKAGKA